MKLRRKAGTSKQRKTEGNNTNLNERIAKGESEFYDEGAQALPCDS